jgi:prepilin-type N-terminal cleavage/methylation domain-containing protein
MLSRNRYFRSSSRGFSLVELLVVMAVLVVMLSLAGPAMNALKGANDVNQAAADLSGLLEQARAYAMANNTFTYVGIAQTEKNNTYQVKLAVWASKQGIRQNNISAIKDDLLQIGRVKTLENAKLSKSIDQYKTKRPDVDNAAKIDDQTASSGLNLSTGTSDTKVDFKTFLRFSPGGAVQLDSFTDPTDNLRSYYEIGLKQTRGNNDNLPNANSAVIQVSGLTGSVQTYRP